MEQYFNKLKVEMQNEEYFNHLKLHFAFLLLKSISK